MLARKFRLSKKGDIDPVLKKGRYLHVSGLFLIKWLKNELPHHRITFVVSSKVCKKATDRNRIKRVLSNDLAPELLQGRSNYDIVVIAKNGIMEKLPEAHSALEKHLTGINSKHGKKN